MASDGPELEVAWLGRIPYVAALELQRARREAVIAGEATEILWLLEHDPVVTTGRRPVPGLDAERLGVPVVPTERGGLATWHGPGQIVGYPIVHVTRRGGGVRRTVEAVERGVIAWLASQGLQANRVADRPGVWVGRNKICAVGLHFSRGVSMHGFALNLTADLSAFGRFVPCGLSDAGVTSVAVASGWSPTPEQAWRGIGACVVAALVDSFRDGG